MNGQFRDNQDIKDQFDATGETFERSPIEPQEEAMPAKIDVWAWLIVATLAIFLFVIIVEAFHTGLLPL